MTVSLTPKAEQLLQEELTRGQYAGAGDVIERAVMALREHADSPEQSVPGEDPISRLRRHREGLTLGGLLSSDLRHEGHRY